MQDASSADAAAAGRVRRQATAASLDVSAGARAAMVALGFIPLMHVVAALAPLVLAASGRAGWRIAWLFPAVLFLLPPLLVRLATLGRALPTGRLEPGSPAFLYWWFTAQCQVVFARLPMLEEVLRLVPGLYSAWLRLWGAQIGSLVYWSPGVTILDRPFVRVGSRVVFGVGARLNPHVLAPDGRGVALYVAPVSVGDDVLIGGYSLLLTGCEIASGEVTPPFRSVHAYSRLEGGRRAPVPGSPAHEVGV